ncbi:hypothetical protein P7C70_g5583, partial [Phenoliferia sp. Uapishka_3]
MSSRPRSSFSSVLPRSLLKVRDDYKRKQSRVTRWLVNACETRNLSLDSSASSASTGSSTSQRGGKRQPKKGKQPPTTSKPARKPLPTQLSVGQLVKLATELSLALVDEKVPEDVLELLSDVIDGRSTVSQHFTSGAKAPSINTEQEANNITHRFMTDALKKVRLLLKNCGLKKKDESDADVLNLSSLELVLRKSSARPSIPTDGLEDADKALASNVVPEDSSDWIPSNQRHLLEIKAAPATPSPADQPLGSFGLIEDVGVDVSVAAFCFLSDVERLVNYVDEAWKACAENEISLVTATVLTSQAVELVKTMESDLKRECGSALGKGMYQDVVHAMLGFERSNLSDLETIGLLEETAPPHLADFLNLTPFLALLKFAGVLRKSRPQSGQTNTILFPVHRAWPGPSAGERILPRVRSIQAQRADGLEGEEDGGFFLMSNYARRALQVATITLHSEAGALPDDEALYADTRIYVKDLRHAIPVHLVFQYAVWLRSVHAFRANLDKPLETALTTANAISQSAKLWIKGPHPYDPMLGRLDNDVEDRMVKVLESTYIPDSFGATTLRLMYGIGNGKGGDIDIKKHHDLRTNPWAAGLIQLKSLSMTLLHGVNVVNATGNLSTTLQLYNALRLYNKISAISWMDDLLALCAPTMFAHGKPPAKGEITLSNYYNIQGLDLKKVKRGRPLEEGFSKTGSGLGVLPQEWGASLVADLAVNQHWHINDVLFDELIHGKPHASVKLSDGERSQWKQGKGLKVGKSAVGAAEVFVVLDKLKHRTEDDLARGGLALDLFAIERAGYQIFRRWSELAGHIFKRAYGPKYQEHESQNSFMFGYLFACVEKHSGPMSHDDGELAFDLAKQAFSEVMGEVDRAFGDGQSLRFPRAQRRL